jgi:hypothetical protein
MFLSNAAFREDTPMQTLDESSMVAMQSGQTIEQRAQVLLSQHSHFRGRANSFDFEYCDDVLIVRGCVPTFYLKQLLQTALKEFEGVTWIDNQVDVVASRGVSSVRRELR